MSISFFNLIQPGLNYYQMNYPTKSGLGTKEKFKLFLDDRPYFKILGEKYKNANPNSKEEILIPIRKK